jgi:glycosyltransferase involved in cell wall biosynthesis
MNTTADAVNAEIRQFVSGLAINDGAAPGEPQTVIRLSIVIPSYNQAAYLEKTILSIVNQHYPNTEIIVMDGGSTDGSLAVLEKYRQFIDTVRIGEDEGQADAINKGFALATGDFVAWQNSDDLYLPGYFHYLNTVIQRDRAIDFVVANYYAIDEHDTILYATHFGPFMVDALLNYEWNLGSQTAFVRRDLARKVGPMPLFPVAFDWYWFIRVGQASARTAVLKHYGGCYRLHEEAKLSAFDRAKRAALEQEVRALLGTKDQPAGATGSRLKLKQYLHRRLKRLNRALLYPKPDQRFRFDRAWAALLNRLGYTLIGFG